MTESERVRQMAGATSKMFLLLLKNNLNWTWKEDNMAVDACERCGI